MKLTCSRCGKEISKNVTLYSVDHKLPSEGREYACWECLAVEEKARHMKSKAVGSMSEATDMIDGMSDERVIDAWAVIGLVTDNAKSMSVVEYSNVLRGIHALRGERIVRCRDCRYLTEDDTFWHCIRWGTAIDFICGDEKPDEFCSWGERKVG